MILSIDFETRSLVNLKTAGLHRYAQDPSTDVWCFAWALDDAEPELWWAVRSGTARYAPPAAIQQAVAAGAEMRAYNANFERLIWKYILVPRYGFPAIRDASWWDTAADAAAMALPRSLGECAAVLGLTQQKDEEGGRLAVQMSKPRSQKDGKIIWWDEPEKLAALGEYCRQDVRTERAVYHATRRLSPAERELYLLDQRMNDRGVEIDQELVQAAQRVVATGLERVNQQVTAITQGAVTKITNTADLRAWIGEELFEAPIVESVRKSVVRAMLEDSSALPPEVAQVLEARADAGRSSVAKLKTMLETVTDDGRVKDTLLFHGAGTGRWAGKGIQPQNFVRPLYKYAELQELVPVVLTGDYDTVDLFHPPLSLVSSMLRTMIRAAPGYRFLVGDYKQIEARVLAWLAGEHWLIEAFARGEPIYERMASVIFRVPAEEIGKDDPRRQLGKNTELGCGYGMGGETFAKQAWERDGVRVAPELAVRAVEAYRELHQMIVQLWFLLGAEAMRAVEHPGEVTSVCMEPGPGRPLTRFVVRGAYLYLILPSGRLLTFAKPRIRARKTPWGEIRPAVVVEGVNSLTHRWQSYALYGGLLVENIVQALARDIMAEAMLRMEPVYQTPVLTVHDEIVAETPLGVGDLQHFRQLMAQRPRWAQDCPIDVDAWEGLRYGKQ